MTSKDAGISSAKTGANPVHRKPKVSAVQFVCCGSVGPKARPLGVVDGCQVYIPEPGVKVKLAGTPWKNLPRLLVCRADPFGVRQSNPVTSGEGVPLVIEVAVKWLERLFTKNTGLC